MQVKTSKRVQILSMLLLAAGLLLIGFTAVAQEGSAEEISDEVRSALQVPLQDKVKALRDLKNDAGDHNVRGFYMQRFVKVDDDTYEVIFHKRTAGKEELTTERYLLTLKLKEGTKNKWEIAGEESQREIDGYFYRGVLDDETFHEFDSFTFEREGIKVSAGKGSMVINYWRGKPSSMSFRASNMKYDYAPPPDLSYYQMSKVLKKMDKYSKDVWFDLERIRITCSETDCEEIMATSFKGLRDSTIDRLDSKVAHAYREGVKKTKERRKENPMSGFGSHLYPERRWYNISVKRQGAREHWAWLSYDSFAPLEVDFAVSKLGDFSLYGPLFSYYAKETRESGISPYDLEVRPDIDALDYDVLSIVGDVEIALADADTMTCDLTYTVKLRRPVEVLNFRIAQIRDKQGAKSDAKKPSMQVKFMENSDGEELTYIARGGASGWVVLPEKLPAGEELTLHVKFTNKNSLFKLNPSYSYVSRGGWLPFVRFGDMIEEFDLTIHVDDRYEILGVGHKVSDEVKDNIRTARFASDSAVNFPTVIFGDYEKDQPKFSATKLDGSEIPVTIYVDKTSMMQYGQWDSYEEAIGELRSGISEIRGSALRPLAEQAANALNLYREVYGVDYPFGKLDLVNDPVGPGFYGQAPASIIYLGSGVFQATGEVAHFVRDGEMISKFKESVVAHETAHQWWGSLITMGNGRNYWFVESLAEYSAALYIENLYASQKSPEAGRKAYLEKVAEWRKEVLEAGSMASVQDVDTMWSGGAYPGQARTAAIYNQGPFAFHVLRETFGDEKFFAFLKTLAQSLAGREVVTRDIQMIAEQSFGGNMDWFFDQWIRGVGLPEYAFNYKTRRAEDGSYIVEGNIKQRIVVGGTKEVLPGKTFRGVVTITVTGRDKKEYPVKILVEKETTPFVFKVPVEPREIALNENGGMLAHDVLVNRDF
jgi:hypothetical protein